MKIKIVRETGGKGGSGHVYIYAWSNDVNDVYLSSKNENITSIKFDFYAGNGAALSHISNPPSDLENHNSVVVDSNVSFQKFCATLRSSAFNDRSTFDLSHHNCVHSVIYALEVAKINIEFEKSYSCKHLIFCCFCPSTLTTPRELISTLKQYKNKQYLVRDNSACEETPLLERNNRQHNVIYMNEEQAQQLQSIEEIEALAVRYERLSLASLVCATSSILCCAGSGVGIMLSFNAFSTSCGITSVPGLVASSVTSGLSTLSFFGSCVATNKFASKADDKEKLIEGKYAELRGHTSP